MEYYKQLLDNNKTWVETKLKENDKYFETLSKGQKPPVLWIGCADSRVPANEITGTQPGEVFVHRNIANMVIHSDMSMLSVLDYAVNVLKVSHIIVCGHYGCGGVLAAMSDGKFGLIDNWLRHIKDVYRLHQAELDAINDKDEKGKRFVELNVKEQVLDLTHTSIVQNAWQNGQNLHVHGWVYDIANGLIKDLDVNASGTEDINKIFKLAGG
jgi:carbonic anhydrase